MSEREDDGAKREPVIVVLEGESSSAEQVTRCLARAGARLLGPVSSAEGALALAEAELPDLMVAALVLPGGEDTTQVAATLRARLQVPTLFLHAPSDASLLERACAVEPVGFASKPVVETELRASLALALRGRELERRLVERELELDRAQACIRNASAATSASEARFRAVFEGSPDAMLVVANDGKVVLANSAAERIFGDGSESLCGVAVEELVPEHVRTSHRRKRAAFQQTPERRIMAARSTVYTRNRRGIETPLEVGLSALEIDGVPHVLVLARNISELRRQEGQIARLQKLDALGRLASGAAHDFNNMVTVISGLSGMLQSMLEGQEDILPLVSDIREASERAGALTKQLLTFARQLPAERKLVELNDEIARFAALLRRTLLLRCTLVLDLDPESCRASIDVASLQQVLLNLVINARDAMPNGGSVTIRTRANQTCASGARCHLIEVADVGTGIPDEVKARLFEPLFTTKSAGEGTGLGLATVYGIVTQAEGSIELESRPGAGTTFRIFLPTSAARESE